MDIPPKPPLPITPGQLRTRAGRVCVALAGLGMLDLATTAVQENSFFEFRLDSVENPSGLLAEISEFLKAHTNVTAIATCRRTSNGGGFDGTAAQQIALLAEAARSGCMLADVEVETAEELGVMGPQTLRDAGAAVILSWHDFAATPDLDAVLERLQAFAPDFLKIVPTAQSLLDSVRLVDLLERHAATGRLIAMSMGQRGVLTRILGPRFGSAFTFASPDGAEGTAPGQISAGTLKDLYRVESITANTAVYAVAGSPIGASLSPRMQNTALHSAGIDAVYLPVETADARELLHVVERLDIRGLSITMPLKEAVLPLLTHRDRTVVEMGACNTIVRRPDGKLAGYNTDVAGIVQPLERVMSIQGKRVLVLGAGGAARAAVFGLRERGADVFLLNRTASRAAALAQESGAHVQPRSTLLATHFDILINSTPYGMRGKQMEAPITPSEMNCSLFFDLVYNPVETPLIRAAAERGIAVIPGVAMFVEQGVRQFFLWTGQVAPEGDMLRVVTEALSAS